MFGLFTVNYIVGSGIAYSGCDNGFQRQFSPLLISLGILVGILFVCSYILMVATIKKLGVTIPVSLMRLSAVLPTFGSMLFFAEIPASLQLAGIALAFFSLPFASKERIAWNNLTQVLHNGFGWGLLLFGVFGITNFVFKIQYEILPLENPYHFLMIIFPTSCAVSGLMAIRYRASFTKEVVLLGMLLGILNLFSSYFLMKALQELPGIVVYPINGIGIILVSAITSLFIWKELLTGKNYIFIGLASLALLLIYPHS